MKIALAWLDPADPTDRAVALGLGRELRRLGHDLLLVGPRRRAGNPERERVGGLPLFRVGPGVREASRRLLELHERERPDVWHCHVFARGHAALSRAARAGRFPMVLTLHLVLRDYLPFVGGRRGLSALLASAARVTTVSEASRAEFLSLFPRWRARSSVVYNGAAEPPRSIGPVPAGPYALYASRLAPYKGPDLLLMAFARVLEEHPAWRLLMCGRDQTAGGARRLARALGIESRARLLGGVSPARLAALMRGCGFFVLPSRRENFPLALLEAMRLGKASVAAAAGGVPEMLRHGREGLLVPPGDVSALAAAMSRLAADPALRARLGRAARTRAERFTWGRVAAGYVRLYRRARFC